MKVLVTGAAGFIGSNFMHYARKVRPDWKLTGLDRLTYAGNIENINQLIEREEIGFIRANIVEGQKMTEIFAAGNFDLVFHFAAESHVDRSIHNAAEFVLTNVVGTQSLLSAARAVGIKRFIHVSTDEVYGSLGPEGRFTELTPLDPTSPYSASKASSDLLALAFEKTYGLDVCVTRCTNNYGPYQFPEKLIPLFITNALDDHKLPLYGDGLNVRSWLYVTDHCEALIRVAESGRPGQVYNIGGEERAELTNKEVTNLVLEKLNLSKTLIQPVADRPAHDRRYAVSIDKIRAELGWEPTVEFDQGLALTIDWYSDNRGWWERVKTGEYLDFYKKNYAARGTP